MGQTSKEDPTQSAIWGPPASVGVILDEGVVESIVEPWRAMAARLALACIADGGDFREEALRDYRKMIEEGSK